MLHYNVADGDPRPAGVAQGQLSVEAFAGEPLGVGRIAFDPSQAALPEPLGVEGVGLTEKHGRIALSDDQQSGLRQNVEGNSRRQHAADIRRAGSTAHRRAAARHRRPAASRDAVFPLSRRRAARSDVGNANQRAAEGRAAAKCRRPSGDAATMVGAIRQTLRPAGAQARLSAGDRNVFDRDARPAIESPPAGRKANRAGRRVAPQGVGVELGRRIAPHGDDAGPRFGSEQSRRAGRPSRCRRRSIRRRCSCPSRKHPSNWPK